MFIEPGSAGRFLVCQELSLHHERRPLGDEQHVRDGRPNCTPWQSIEICPKCGDGALISKRGRFGLFFGCSRYPDCDYIGQDAPPPDPLAFEVACPRNDGGRLQARRARRTGNVFWGCSKYPKCDYTTNDEPLGGLHDADDGPIGRKGEKAICLVCGSAIEAEPASIVPGERYPGGPPDPAAIARPERARRGREVTKREPAGRR